MASTTKQMNIKAGTAHATVNATVNDGMPAFPCPDPAGYRYVGARYVPLFADPMEWNSANTYEPLTIVLHEGNSYTSKQFVPVGVDIDNTTYWAETGNYNAQVEQYRQEVLKYLNSIKFSIGTLTSSMELNDPTTNAETLETYLSQGPVFVDTDVTFNNTLNIPNGAFIQGFGSLNGPISMSAELQESNVDISVTSPNKLNSSTPFNIDSVALIYEQGVNRQAVMTITSGGDLLNSAYYTNCNKADIYRSCGDITIRDITINGVTNIEHAANIVYDNVTVNGKTYVTGCVKVTFDTCVFNFNTLEDKLDVRSGCSLVSVINCVTNGGGTVSDNGAIKFNETFDSYINVVSSIADIDGGGYYHSVFIDSNYTEDGYPLNRSRNILIERCTVANDIFVSVSDNVVIMNCKGNVHTKNSTVTVKNCELGSLYIENSEGQRQIIETCAIATLTTSSANNCRFIGCVINSSITNANNLSFYNCDFDRNETDVTLTNCDNLIIKHCRYLSNLNITSCDIVDIDIEGDLNIIFRQCSNIYGVIREMTKGETFHVSFYQTDTGIIDCVSSSQDLFIYDDKSNNNLIVNDTMGGSATNGIAGAITFGEGAPTTGYHRSGQIVFNSKPQVNQTLMWICTTSGEPGTWNAFGTITNG